MTGKEFDAEQIDAALDRYIELDAARAGGLGRHDGADARGATPGSAADDAALFARCDAVMALTPRLAASPDLAWAFEEARRIARSAPQASRPRWRWLQGPALAWSLAGVASVVCLAVLVATRWPAGMEGDGAAGPSGIASSAAPADTPVTLPLNVEDLIARIDPVVLIGNEIPVDGRSIALLPFAEEFASVDDDDIRAVAATADAIHARLIRQLRAIPGVYVAEPGTTAAYAEAGASPEEIARYLGVRGVVRGSIRSDGQLVSLDLRFMDAAREGRAITRTFAGSVEQLAMLETDVATGLLDALGSASTWSE